MIQTIASKDNKKVKETIALYCNKERKEKGLFIVEGYHLLEMALAAKKLKCVFSLEKVDDLPDEIEQYLVSEEILKKMSKTQNPQGIVAVCSVLEQKEIIGNAIYLDEVSDPGNVGTILRTALAFGFYNVILSSNCASLYNDKVISSSQGSIFKLNVIENGEKELLELKKRSYTLCGTALNAKSKDFSQVNLKTPFVLIFGNEARGVSSIILQQCDEMVMIPIKNIDSLNVGVACGIILNHYSNS